MHEPLMRGTRAKYIYPETLASAAASRTDTENDPWINPSLHARATWKSSSLAYIQDGEFFSARFRERS